MNHIPNGNLLTNKLGLLNSLQEYERVTMSTKGRPPRLRFTDFVPETYRFDEKHDREAFMECYKGRTIIHFYWCSGLSGHREEDLNTAWLKLCNAEYEYRNIH